MRSTSTARLLIRRSACALVVLFAATVGSSLPAAQVQAGGSERIMAFSVIARVTLTRGSELGTICYEAVLSNPDNVGPGFLVFDISVRRLTPPALVIGDVEYGSTAPATHCVSGLDQVLVTDVFANPSNYAMQVDAFSGTGEDCGGTPCSSSASPFAPEGSACDLFPNRSITFIRANEPFVVDGSGFVPGSTIRLVFTPQDDPGSAGATTVLVDLLSAFRLVLVPAEDQVGFWLISSGACADEQRVQVIDAATGSTYPAGGTPFPSAGAAEPEPGLPDTAMPAIAIRGGGCNPWSARVAGDVVWRSSAPAQ